MPSYVKEILYIPVCEMDLSSAKKRHSTLGEQGSATPDPREKRNVQATTAEEQANFFERISNCWIKPAILSIVAPYNAAFVPVENKTVPKPLTERSMKRIWETPCRSYSKSLKQLLMSSR